MQLDAVFVEDLNFHLYILKFHNQGYQTHIYVKNYVSLTERVTWKYFVKYVG